MSELSQLILWALRGADKHLELAQEHPHDLGWARRNQVLTSPSSPPLRRPEVLVTLTQDEGKVMAALHDVKSSGEADLMTGIQVAQVRRLVLPRIVVSERS